jgi:hypothetical protein
MKRTICPWVAAMIVLACSGRPDVHAQDTTKIDVLHMAAVSSLTLGTVVGVHIYQRNAWWQGQRAPFRFENDWVYALNIDKFGHTYGAYLLSNIFKYSLSWCSTARCRALPMSCMLK